MSTKFKPIISIDKGVSDTYRTIITQTTIYKWLTEGNFWKKNFAVGQIYRIF